MFANNEGLLNITVLIGSYPSPNETIIRSVKDIKYIRAVTWNLVLDEKIRWTT
jgi:hypothetical protein